MLTNDRIGCVLLAMKLLLNLVAGAFKQGMLWGVVAIMFPAGTYIYCKKYWNIVRYIAIPLAILLAVAVASRFCMLFA